MHEKKAAKGEYTSRARKIFDNALRPSNGDIRDLLYIFFCLSFFFVLGAVCALIFLLIVLRGDPTAIGQAGDFFGGFVNPILTFLTFIGVLLTIFLQQEASKAQGKEAEEQRTAAHKQTFETTYFQMVSLHNDIVSKLNVPTYKINAIHGGYEVRTLYGREAIAHLVGILQEDINREMVRGLSSAESLVAFQSAYANRWKDMSDDIGHYFRLLLNIIRYIDESEFKRDRLYVRLLRAQLSNEELRLLFYNCLTPQGTKFKAYAEAHALFENVPDYVNLEPLLIDQFQQSAFVPP